ncbi:uncharacterized protein LOC104913111 [Meleagris gallopavo]|uniref:uncharacterized protein LOC104913111 n=1 Tax=Meleagris gallopavo TaxID=9103 RepID=UPI0012AC59E7|nr:uncharacterized protein LOC104913111 [Meleagris gallopavo]
MRELPGALRDPIFQQLVELLSTSFYSWEMVAMVFLIEMLECMDLTAELHRILKLFTTYLQSQSVGMQQLVLRGILQLSKRQDTARPMIIFLPCIMEQLQDADSDVRALALPILSTLLKLLDGAKISLMALELASKLPALFNDASTTVRQLSMDLFLETLNFVEGQEKRKMQKEVCRNLALLYLHLHDEEDSVAKASQKALLGAARFLRWRRLEHLVQTEQFWQIGECLQPRRSKGSLPGLRPFKSSAATLATPPPREPLSREVPGCTDASGIPGWSRDPRANPERHGQRYRGHPAPPRPSRGPYETQAGKLSFLACVRTACTAALQDRQAHEHLCACASHVVQCIEAQSLGWKAQSLISDQKHPFQFQNRVSGLKTSFQCLKPYLRAKLNLDLESLEASEHHQPIAGREPGKQKGPCSWFLFSHNTNLKSNDAHLC